MLVTKVKLEQLSADYALVEKAIHFIEEHQTDQPDLKEIASYVGLSEYHFQRLFSRWAGISPKRFLQFLTAKNARQLLKESRNILETAYQVGLSGPGRLHDLFITYQAMTPGEYVYKGKGLVIRYGFQPTPFGEALIAKTGKGICNLRFVGSGMRQEAENRLKHHWSRAELVRDDPAVKQLAKEMFSGFIGGSEVPLRLYLKGTNFQLKVWEALLKIPTGKVVAYQDIAVHIGMPGAARAVGQAVGRNPVAVLIPCHRVLRKAGDIGGYRWGTARKKAILGWEFAHTMD